MKTKRVLMMVGVLVALGLVLYVLAGKGLRSTPTKNDAPVAQTVNQPAAGHQGHGGVPPAGQQGAEEARAVPPSGETPEAPTVEIPLDKQQMIGLKTAVARMKSLTKVIRTVGRVEYDEKRLATANTKIEGWIEKLYVDYTGRYVKKGEPLAELYSPELVATQQEFLNILKWADRSKEVKDERTAHMLSGDAEAILEASKQRLRLLDITDDQIKKIAATGKPVRTLTIYSPVSGYVIQKTAIQGMRVMPGEKLFDVADLSIVWITADIYEYELPLIKVGQTALISLSYFPGREFSSRVDYLYPSLAGDTRTAKARFTIPNPGGELKPQMFTNVEIRINLGSRLAVPADAVIDTGVRQIVYVDRGEGNFEPREVMPGLRSEDMVEIIRGLKAGERVAASANFMIDSEAQLKGVAPLPLKKNR
jgi:membrane fusion protein, copper/silver efflux system